jgi:hypothetical protein
LKIRTNNNTTFASNKKRWAIISGEINAGNDSEELKSEALKLLNYFKACNSITAEEFKDNFDLIS